MTAHVTLDLHQALDRRVERNGVQIDEMQSKQGRLEGELKGVTTAQAQLHQDQQKGFARIHDRIDAVNNNLTARDQREITMARKLNGTLIGTAVSLLAIITTLVVVVFK